MRRWDVSYKVYKKMKLKTQWLKDGWLFPNTWNKAANFSIMYLELNENVTP